jgi:peptide/nickel transport system substrate-binding protein
VRIRVERRHRRVAVVAIAALLAAGLMWGIANALAQSESPAPAGGKVQLKLGWTNDPDNLNPFIGYESSSYEVWALNYDLLVGFRASDMTNQPNIGLATGWETSEDGLVWTFTVEDGVTWQDGEPFTAADVAFTFTYIIENELGAFIDYCNFIEKVEAPDDTHVVFTCSRPKANMLALWIPILPEHVWSKVDPARVESAFQNKPPIVGTGPFQTVEWKKGEYLRMEANPNYWKGAPQVDEVIFQTYQNQDTMAQDLKSGNLQTGWNVPPAQFDSLDQDPNLAAITGQLPGYDELGFNCADKSVYPKSTGHPVLQDAAFRRALQWAIDKDKIVSIAYQGDAKPADTIIMSDYYGQEADYHWEPPAGDPDTYVFDLERAKQELDAAGYTDGDGNGVREYEGEDIELRLYARTESSESQSCGKLITGWFEEVGLDIDYQVIDDGRLGDLQFAEEDGEFAPDFDMFIWGWGGDVDPNFLLSIMTTNQIWSWSDCNWSNEEYDRLFQEQQTTIDLQERIELVRQMQQIVYEESPYILLVYPLELEAYNEASWQGWVRSSGGKGLIWYNTLPDTYLAVQPGAAETEEEGSSPTGLIVGVVIAALVAIAIVAFVVRGRGRRVEEV